MKEISLHILDIARNSVKAGATLIKIAVKESSAEDLFSVEIEDNGCGMSRELLQRVCDPFTTSRTTRKVGLGIPLFKTAAEMTGGSFEISSEEEEGTLVKARFIRSSIDRQPLGNIAETLLGLITSHEDIDFEYIHSVDDRSFRADTREMKKILGDISLSSPEVYLWLEEYLKEGEEELFD